MNGILSVCMKLQSFYAYSWLRNDVLVWKLIVAYHAVCFLFYYFLILGSFLHLSLVTICLMFYLLKQIIFCLPGFPILGVEWQKIENPDLRLSMGMKPDQKGVRIRRIDPTSPEHSVLKPSDIILSFDGVDIANDGTGMMQIWVPCSI